MEMPKYIEIDTIQEYEPWKMIPRLRRNGADRPEMWEYEGDFPSTWYQGSRIEGGITLDDLPSVLFAPGSDDDQTTILDAIPPDPTPKRHPNQKPKPPRFSPAEARYIRALYLSGKRQDEIAEMFSVGKDLIGKVCRGTGAYTSKYLRSDA